MYVAEVIPIIKEKIPGGEMLTYFTSQEIPTGSLVAIPFRKKQVMGVVSRMTKLVSTKASVRKSSFALKKISDVVLTGFFSEASMRFILDTAEYYMIPPAILLYHALPKYFLTRPHLLKKEFVPVHGVSSMIEVEKKRVNIVHPQTTIFVGAFEKRIDAYADILHSVLRIKKQVLILAPEIESAEKLYALAAQYSKKTVLLTGNRTSKKQARAWFDVKTGETEIIVGTRASLFLPFRDLGVVIVDEEESPSYRIWDGAVRYDPAVLAKKLATLRGTQLILGAAIPRPETLYYGKKERAEIKVLASAGSKAAFHIVDMKQEQKEKRGFVMVSGVLEQAIRSAIAKKEHVILFANRRGYASFILCEDCGFIFQCQKCAAPLIFHKEGVTKNKTRVLLCHQCGAVSPVPDICHTCRSHQLKTYGVGSERIEEYMKQLFPHVPVLRLDSDTTKDVKDIQEKIRSFTDKKPSILVGTQMMIKHVLPIVPLVGIISIDALLYLPDFRQEERIFHLIASLKRRARKNIILQTLDPEKEIFTLALSGDYQKFYARELKNRQDHSWPPFSQLIKLSFDHRDPLIAKKETERMRRDIEKLFPPRYPLFQCFSMPAFIARQDGKYIFNIIIKLPPESSRSDRAEVIKFKKTLFAVILAQWRVEVDPNSILN